MKWLRKLLGLAEPEAPPIAGQVWMSQHNGDKYEVLDTSITSHGQFRWTIAPFKEEGYTHGNSYYGLDVWASKIKNQRLILVGQR